MKQALDFINCLEFKTFSKLWAEKEVIEPAFIDWLLEQGLELQAEAVVEANKIKVRGIAYFGGVSEDTFGGYRPWYSENLEVYCWSNLEKTNTCPLRSNLPEELYYKLKIKRSKIPEEVIAAYLDAYAEVKNAQTTT